MLEPLGADFVCGNGCCEAVELPSQCPHTVNFCVDNGKRSLNNCQALAEEAEAAVVLGLSLGRRCGWVLWNFPTLLCHQAL